ncbi:YncE family protein [Rugamonas aquatica]|uniref:YncE family protein n=1 Tax=Rugamonas aquatica TaxID=2743357 RepID=A0A6A7MWZ9_9BURK|nr:YncE family protein [Rugamonas aquatica]MQA37273.1 YncE family protein [Rugamonas aquatica]
MKKTLSAVLSLALTAGAAGAADYSVRQQWPLDGAGRWDYLDIDTAHQRLFITRGDRLQALELASGKVIGEVGGLRRAHGVAFAPKLGVGFVTSGDADSVVVFDLESLKTRSEVRVSGKNPDAVLYEEGSGKLYTFNGKSADVSVFDAATMAPKATIAVKGKPEFAVSDGRRIYVNIEDKNQIAVIDIATDKMVAQWPLAGCDEPTGLALDAAHKRLFSVCGNGVLAVTDAASGKAVARAAIGKGADAVVFDAASATVFSSNGEGTLTLIRQTDADHYAAPVTVKTVKGARTMAMDHANGRLYLPTLVEQRFTVLVTTP